MPESRNGAAKEQKAVRRNGGLCKEARRESTARRNKGLYGETGRTNEAQEREAHHRSAVCQNPGQLAVLMDRLPERNMGPAAAEKEADGRKGCRKTEKGGRAGQTMEEALPEDGRATPF